MGAKQTRGQLRQIEADLMQLDQRMRSLCSELPSPEFEAGTDRPLNASAEIYGLLSSTLDDEIRSAVASLRRALSVSSELGKNRHLLQ